MEDENYYSTSDLSLIALLSLYFTIEKINTNNLKRVVFSFKDNEELQDTIDKFNKQKLTVEPSVYYNQLRKIKTMIYGEQNK